jgi:hypothetical protein
MPRVVGMYGDKAHDDLVHEIEEVESFYRQQLTPSFVAMVKRWRLYLAERDDHRLPHEKWRANTFVPYPFSGAETKIAALCEVMNSTDPPIQAEGFSSDEKIPRKMERVHAYTLSKNRWSFQQDQAYRDMVVQGTCFWKLTWGNRSTLVNIHPTEDQLRAFDKAVNQAVGLGAPPPPEDPEAFREWRETVNTARQFGLVPEQPLPAAGQQEIVEYRGPWLERPFIGDLRFDPMIEDIQDQQLVIHRVVKKRKWVEDRAGLGPEYKFDPAQVAAAHAATQDTRFSEWDEQIASMLGIPRAAQADPLYQDAVELWECWRPGTAAPYCVIMNRKAVINKTPDTLPYWHGKLPFIPVRNVPVSRRLLGISDLQQTERLYLEMNVLHNLLLDAVTLAVIPCFTKKRGSGLVETQRYLRPGGFLDVDVADAIQSLTKFDPGLQWAFRMIQDLKGNIDETNATGPNVRGSAATIGRVSATESQGRLSQALLRTKQQVLRIEEEHQAIPMQAAFLWYQFGEEKVRLRIGGDELAMDPFVEMDRGDFLQMLGIDFRFRGATKALNRELSAQQLDAWLKTATQAAALMPKEIRAVLAKIYEIQGHKGVGTIITDEGTASTQEVYEASVLAARAQVAAAQQAAQQAQLQSQPTPEEVPVQGAAA